MTATTIYQENELTPLEADDRTHHESVVDSAIESIRAVSAIGDASLKVLRDKRLYRSTHKTFEDYCQGRFGITRRSANYRLAFAEILENLGTMVPKLPTTERQARPLSKLPTPELQAAAWELAQQIAADERKTEPTAKMVAEAVKAKEEEIGRLQAEKATANRRLDEWRSQAIAEKKTREEAEAAAKLRANELAKLKGSVDESANRLAAIRTSELKAELEMAKLEKAELDKKLKSAKTEREDAINRGVTNRLREQQEQVSRIESQLQALEHRRESLKRQIEPMEKSAASAAHHDKHVRALDQLINQASLEVMDAFDPDFCTHLPAHFVEVWERGIDKLRQLTAMLEQQVSSIHVMRLEREL